MLARSFRLAILCVALAGCMASDRRSGEAPVLLVSAAISLAETLQTVANLYQASTATVVQLNVAGSDTLATQLLGGAPADVFVSADERQMDRVEAGGGILPPTRVDLLSNQLVVVARQDSPVGVSHVEELVSSRVGRIAMGDPAAVPAGVYAKRYLQSVELWDALQPKIVPTRSVRGALAAVEAGNADVGFVYRTDLAVPAGVRLAFAIPVDDGPRIRYTAAVTTSTRHPSEATRFLAFLTGPEADRVFMAAGFLPLPETSP